MTINRVSNGESNVDHNPGGESLHLEKDKWYKVKVNLGEGNKVSAFIDGKKVFEQMASAPPDITRRQAMTRAQVRLS